MKRNLLTIILICIAAISFAQVPKHQRVLNYVPDSCYSVTLINLDTLARVMELEAMHTEKVLKPLYDSLKFSKKLVQSWLKRDNKLGIDFTATAAMADSRYYFLPLNNEKNFEKMVRSLDKSLPPFETMTDPEGRKFRCMTIESDYEMNFAVICTEDVACIVQLTDMNAMFNSMPTNESMDTFNIEAWLNSVLIQENPLQVWDRMSHSKFATSETATTMLTNGWNSFIAYKQGNSLLKTLSGAMTDLVPASTELQKTVSQLDMVIFSKGEARHDRISSYSEIQFGREQAKMPALKSSPAAVKRLLPYVSGDYIVMIINTMEGYGDLMEPYMSSFPQWREICPMMNKPFVFTMSSFEEKNMQIATLVEHPEQVHGILERYVETCNHITDSTFKARKNMVIEEVVEEPVKVEEISETPETMPEKPAEPVDIEFDTMEMFGQSFASAVDPEDSTIDMKTLVYKKINGWDVYIILTNKKEMDYETYTQIVKEDSSCVLVKDGLLLYTKSLDLFGTLTQPLEREWPKEYFEHSLYARGDLSSLVAILGPEAALPVRDIVCYVDKNTFTMNVNAEPGLRHGVLYEVVKYMIDLIQRLD